MASAKIVKAGGKTPDEFELRVAEEIYKIESTPEMKADMENLYILGAKEFAVPGNRKAAVVVVPFKLLKRFRKIQPRLVRELEKKLQGYHVVIIGHRTILGDGHARNIKTKGLRPRSRTLVHVQEAILEDLVFPTEIVGKRTRHRLDGSRLLKVYLNPKDQVNVETKLDTFATVYQKLTQKNVVFEFPVEN